VKRIFFVFISVVLAASIFSHQVDADISNWDRLESNLVTKLDRAVWREGNILHLKLLDGRTIRLSDVPYDPKKYSADAVAYRLVDHIVPVEYFVLGLSYQIGERAMVVDRKTGECASLCI